MNRENIKMFLAELTDNHGIEMLDAGDWVMTNCILAPWTHEGGTDSKPSFGIHVSEGRSTFHCFTCKSKGSLSGLVRLYEKYTGEEKSYLLTELATGEMLASPLPEWSSRLANTNRVELGESLDELVLEAYEPAVGHPYLAKRRIGAETVEELGLLVDPDNYGVERILFPVRSANGGLYGFSGRAVSPSGVPRVRDYFGLPKRLLLLGAEHIDPFRTSPIVVVEGLFDFARVFQAGYPVVAVMHSGLTDAQAKILKSFGRTVISFLDNDMAGAAGYTEINNKLGKSLTVLKAKYLKNWGKDPGSLTSKQIEAAIANADLA